MFLALQNLIYQDPPYGEDIINLQSIIFYLLLLFNLNVTIFLFNQNLIAVNLHNDSNPCNMIYSKSFFIV